MSTSLHVPGLSDGQDQPDSAAVYRLCVTAKSWADHMEAHVYKYLAHY